MAEITKETQLYLETFLPTALSKAMKSYEDFSKQDKNHLEDSVFLEHHKACKAAISHVELLLKLAKSIEQPDQKNPYLEGMVQQAKENLKKHQNSSGLEEL